MPDFDTQLNNILSNPAAMAEIAKLAQSLGAPASENPSATNPTPGNPSAGNPAPENLSSDKPTPGNPVWNDTPPGTNPDAPRDAGTIPVPQNTDAMPTPEQNSGAIPPAHNNAPQSPGTVPLFSGTTNAPPSSGTTNAPLSGMASLPPELLTQFLPLFRQLNTRNDSNARRLLYALRPYLPARRQEKIERALQFAKIWCMGKKFLSKRGENDV